MTFYCIWESQVIIITILVSILILGIIIVSFRKMLLYWNVKNGIALFLIFEMLLCSSILVLPILYMPLKLSVLKDEIIIHKIVGQIIIPFEQIKSIDTYDMEKSKNIRIFGSGGLFGYLGYYKNSVLGDFQMYVMDRSSTAVIKTIHESYVVSCCPIKEFILSATLYIK